MFEITYEDVERAYKASPLPSLGVKLPRPGNQKAEVLRYLYEHLGEVVTKEEVERVVCARLGVQPKDLQSVRHLGKQDGYDVLQGGHQHKGRVLSRGQYVLRSFNRANQYWSACRRNEGDLDFAALKNKYKGACATCGAKEGRPHRHTGQIVVLEKGHVDPSQPMTPTNIIPQCPYCNKVAGDKWIWDKMGFPKYMTEEGLLSHSEDQQREFLKTLKEKYDE